MSTSADSPLGKATAWPARYDPGLLFPIERAPNRARLGITGALPFHGVDVWNAYELSWLDGRGKPHVAMAELRVPASSARLIESKSLKLYLNGFAGERLAPDELARRLRQDLGAAAGDDVGVRVIPAAQFAHQQLAAPEGTLIDALEVAIDHYGPPRADFLRADADAAPIRETLVSNLLKSNCPVTGQPDWGSVQVTYTGAPIDHAGLLRYLVSFREHAAFHEDCVERMFIDITRRCAPTQLTVHARYTRRGGIDINPLRSSTPDPEARNTRWPRQ